MAVVNGTQEKTWVRHFKLSSTASMTSESGGSDKRLEIRRERMRNLILIPYAVYLVQQITIFSFFKT